MRRYMVYSFPALLGAALLGLSACGGGDADGTSAASNPPAEGAPSTLPAAVDPYAKYQGNWKRTECIPIDAATAAVTGPEGSRLSTFTIAGRQITVIDNYYNSADCSGAPTAVLTYPALTMTITSSISNLRDQLHMEGGAGRVAATGSVTTESLSAGTYDWAVNFSIGAPFYVQGNQEAISVDGSGTFTSDLKQFLLAYTIDGQPKSYTLVRQ